MVFLETLQQSTSRYTIPKRPPMAFLDHPVMRERMRSVRTMLRNWTVTIQVIIHDRQLTVLLGVDCLGEAIIPLTGDGTKCDVPSPQ